jgi:RNA polymerase sigma-70 factor (ECF subfamily)
MQSSLAVSRPLDLRGQDDEADLVRCAQEDPAAFGVLYERYADRVYSYLRARTDNAEDAADLTQQVFLQALAALPRYKARKVPFAAWLFRIARNLAINFHQRRRKTVAWDLLPEFLQPMMQDDMFARMARGEEYARLAVLFGALDADTRELLVLRFAARLTAAEIASVTGKSVGATRMRLSRTLRALKEQYDDE